MSNKKYIELSDEELQNINGGATWGQIWRAIDGVISPLQSTPSWVQGKHKPIGTAPYVPGGGSWIGKPK